MSAPAILLDSNGYDILLGTSFLVQYLATADFGQKTFTIMGHTVPMYNKIGADLSKGQTTNIIYDNGVISVHYTKEAVKDKSLPENISCHKGIPIRSHKPVKIPAYSQKIVSTGLTLQLPPGTLGHMVNPDFKTMKEPWVAPGIVFNTGKPLEVLLGNLTGSTIDIRRNQIIGFINIIAESEILDVKPCGTFADMGLEDYPEQAVCTVIHRDQLEGESIEDQEKALELFKEFDHIFSKNEHDLGVAKDVLHNIDTGDNPPIKSRPIRRSRAGDTEVNQEINKLLEAVLIKPSKSPWSSPILIVKKKDGTNRVVIDYRRLNEITRKDVYLLPSISDALDRLGGAKYFSAMDLVSGYWQIDLPEEDQQKAAIITPQGLFQPTRMPQGLCYAPATFQRTMDNILSDLKMS